MKCRSCGRRFAGESYDRCPVCFSADTKDVADENDDGYCRSRLMKKTLDIGIKPMCSDWGHPDGISKFQQVDIS